MPKKIDPELKARAVRLVREHRGEYPTLTAVSQAVAKQLGVGKNRCAIQAQVDTGQRRGVTSEEAEETRRLKAVNRRRREDVAILKAATTHTPPDSVHPFLEIAQLIAADQAPAQPCP